MTSLESQHQKIFFVKGNLKNKGSVQNFLPYSDVAYNSWQIQLSTLSYVNKDNALNKIVLVSTNLVKDFTVDKFMQKEIWNPPIAHVKFQAKKNESVTVYVNQNFLNITSYSSIVAFDFVDAMTQEPVTGDVEVFLTIVFRKLA